MSSPSDADDAAPLAPITRLVATIKAQRAAGTAPAIGGQERDHLAAELRQLIAARGEEQRAWQDAMDALKTELDATRAAAQAAETRHEQTAREHRRAMADLELKHEHQRSIWQLDRRRLEITIAGQETVQRARSSRLAVAVALLVVGVFGAALVADHRVGPPSGDAADVQTVFSASGSSR
jgi:Skp family chaperone for outer membrane proteins